MSPSVATAAMSFAAPSQPPLRHVYTLPAATIFVPFRLYMMDLLSLRALHAHHAIIDMCQRRNIGGKPLTFINLRELELSLGCNDSKRNDAAIRELRRLELLRETDHGFYPAQKLDDLRIDDRQREAIEHWLKSKVLNRKNLVIPRVMFEAFPQLNVGQLALNFEISLRCFDFSGDKSRTTGTILLNISDAADRWSVSRRRLHNILSVDPAKNPVSPAVRLEADDTRRFAYRVVVTPQPPRRAGRSRNPIRLPVVPKAPLPEPEPEPVHDCSHSEPEPVHDCSHFLILFLILLLRGELQTIFNPPVGAPESAGRPEEEGTGFCQFQNPGQDQPDFDPSVVTALDGPITTVQIQDGYHGGNTVVVDAPADTAPSPNTAAVEDLDPVDAAAVVTNAAAVDPAICPPSIPAVALVVDTLPKPVLRRVIDADLRDPARLDVLREQAIDAGYIGRSQADRLKFAAAAVRAREEGDNPPAMFFSLVSKGLWTHATAKQEDKASAMLKARDWGAPRPLHVVPKSIPPPALSEDARKVEIVRKWLIAERYRGDPFRLFKLRLDEGRHWTRGRWESACQELDARRETSGRGI